MSVAFNANTASAVGYFGQAAGADGVLSQAELSSRIKSLQSDPATYQSPQQLEFLRFLENLQAKQYYGLASSGLSTMASQDGNASNITQSDLNGYIQLNPVPPPVTTFGAGTPPSEEKAAGEPTVTVKKDTDKDKHWWGTEKDKTTKTTTVNPDGSKTVVKKNEEDNKNWLGMKTSEQDTQVKREYDSKGNLKKESGTRKTKNIFGVTTKETVKTDVDDDEVTKRTETNFWGLKIKTKQKYDKDDSLFSPY